MGVHVVVGASTLYIKESQYRYAEVYFGVEKTFKVQRSRIRLGIYFVEATSNYSKIPPRIKFALNRYSLRDKVGVLSWLTSMCFNVISNFSQFVKFFLLFLRMIKIYKVFDYKVKVTKPNIIIYIAI